MDTEGVRNVILAATSIAAAASAIAAWRSAYINQKASQGALVSKLLVDYDAPAMSEAMQALRSWAEKYGDGFANAWGQAFLEGDDEAKKVDDARRSVGSYFETISRLGEHKLLSRKAVKFVASRAGLHAVRDYILPLESIVNRRVDLWRFHDLFKLCDLENLPLPTRGSFGSLRPVR